MKPLNIFYTTIIFLILLFSSCSNSDTSEATTEKANEEQMDTIPQTNEVPTKIEEEQVDEKQVAKPAEEQVNIKKNTTQKPVEAPSENQDQVKKKTVAKTAPVKTDTYNFIITDVGKQVPDDFKGDLMTSAAEEVYIEKKGKCGSEDCGKKIILVNMNQDKSIEITVGINWKENDEKINKKRSYRLKESQKLEIGCSSKCDENNTTIKWQIIGAFYAN